VKGILGAAMDKNSEKIAEDEALRQCRNKGGNPCIIQTNFSNQCAALVSGDKVFFVRLEKSEQEASKAGLNSCNSEDSNCRVHYSACSQPRFIRY
jgi:Domain of unknown function (DUF4189)